MTNTEIKNIINEVNTNPDIKWSISKNTDTEIVLTNSYDNCVSFTITVKHQAGDEWIVVRDNHMDKRVALLIQGDDRWSDYTYIEHGIKMAIEAAVYYFNGTY